MNGTCWHWFDRIKPHNKSNCFISCSLECSCMSSLRICSNSLVGPFLIVLCNSSRELAITSVFGRLTEFFFTGTNISLSPSTLLAESSDPLSLPSSSLAEGSMHGRTGRKKLGGRKEICPTFSDCARPVHCGDLPPPVAKKISVSVSF